MTRKDVTTASPMLDATVSPNDPATRAAATALALGRQMRELLAPFVHPLADEERQGLVPVPNVFAEVAPTMLTALRGQRTLLAYHEEFDLERTSADVGSSAMLRALENELEQVLRAVHDGVRAREARAYSELLPLYHSAKGRAANDSALRAVVSPFQKVYASRRSPRAKITKE